jgi:PTH1 family peptidyl-tRNA hydrolase
VVVGLRNPGRKYQGTRHNIGAEVVDVLAERWGAPFKAGPSRIGAEIAAHRVGDQAVMLVKPYAYMNQSGPAVVAALRYFKAGTDDLLVIHDDIDLPFARLRLHSGRGAGGHNGVRSIVGATASKDFWRLKVGVGRPPERIDPADFVLRAFASAEREEVDFLVRDGADVIESFLSDRNAAVELAARRRPG